MADDKDSGANRDKSAEYVDAAGEAFSEVGNAVGKAGRRLWGGLRNLGKKVAETDTDEVAERVVSTSKRVGSAAASFGRRAYRGAARVARDVSGSVRGDRGADAPTDADIVDDDVDDDAKDTATAGSDADTKD